jgi:hypothetical protein
MLKAVFDKPKANILQLVKTESIFSKIRNEAGYPLFIVFRKN